MFKCMLRVKYISVESFLKEIVFVCGRVDKASATETEDSGSITNRVNQRQ